MSTSALPTSTKPTGRQSAEDVLAASALPPLLQGVVRRVVTMSRLWKSEKALVARELCAHFEDGLAAGVAPEALVESFGDARQAARLIARARKRLRPLWWRSAKRTLQGSGAFLAVCIVTYLVLLARFYLASPNIARNYVAEFNAALQTVPDAERAWPVYLEARKAIGVLPAFQSAPEFQADNPGDRDWEAMTAWLREKSPALDRVRAAAALPHLGVRYSSVSSPEYQEMLAAIMPGYQPWPEQEAENPLLVGLLLPHLGEFRKFARWLRIDAIQAARDGDAERFLADVEAMLGIARHSLQNHFLISAQVTVVIADLAAETVRDHALTPGLLSDEQIQQLAHSLAGFAGGRVSLAIESERLILNDIVQRFYSDDGQGDGRLVYSAQAKQDLTQFGVKLPDDQAITDALRPVASVTLPSRRELERKIAEFAVRAQADDSLPPWRHDERRSEALYLDVCESAIFPLMPVMTSLTWARPGYTSMLEHSFDMRDMFEAKRAATLALLAAELFRRSHGHWPATLADLSPRFLPSAPLDPFTGQPLKYRAPSDPSGVPFFYSVGPDGVDNSGVAPSPGSEQWRVRSLTLLKDFRNPKNLPPERRLILEQARGDWLIFPAPDEK
jgi:hypothetical protein